MTARWTRIFWWSLCIAGACAPASLHGALTPEKLYQKVLPSVMTLEVESQDGEMFVGTAVLALADDLALTAWHVVADARSVWAVFVGGQRVKVIGYVDCDVRHDTALLKLEKRLPQRQATLGRGQPSVATRAYVIGAPKGYDFSISDGLISQIRSVRGSLQYQLSCPISPGNSGSPVFNPRGEVIGIASWTKADAQNVNFAIPIQEFSHLKVLPRPKTWEQLAAPTRPAQPARELESRPSQDHTSDKKSGAEGYAALQKRLNESVGKSVTVVVQEAGRSDIFNFTVK